MLLAYLILLTQSVVTLALNSTRCKFSDACYPSQEDMAQLHQELNGTLYLPHMDEYKTYALAYNTYEQSKKRPSLWPSSPPVCTIIKLSDASQEDMANLHQELDGTLYLPHMDEYKTYALAYNTYEQRYPSLIAMVKSASDIQAAILWARKYNLHVTIRSSGHCYLGRSTWDGSFNINLAWMKNIEVKNTSDRSAYGEVKVQTGLTWLEIYEEVHKYQRVVVGGSAHTVSPGGYTLGGGHSPVSRSLGYAVDNVLEFQMVLANGEIATCTEEQCIITRTDNTVYYDTSGDLFWAVRGGGGGTYGVVVYLVYKLHLDTEMVQAVGVFPLDVKIPGLSVDLNLKDAVLDAMAALVQHLPKEWGGYWLMDNAYQDYIDQTIQQRVFLHGKVSIFMNKFAPWDGTEKDVFSNFIAISDAHQLGFTFHNKTGFLDYEVDAQDLPTIRTTFFAVLLQNESFNEGFKNHIKKEMYETYTVPELMGCTFIMLGGKTTEFPVDSTPLHRGYRSAHASLTCGLILGYMNESNYFQAPLYDTYLTRKADKSALELRQFGDGMYFNEASKNDPYWRDDFWNDYPRLLAIKKRYDPDNFFTCHQCVGSEEMVQVDTSRGLKLSSGKFLGLLIFTIMRLV